MAAVPLSPATEARLRALFGGSDRDDAQAILAVRCGSDLPFCEGATPESLERIRFAALKLSGGDLASLRSAVDLANTDWRDLLVAAGFANDVHVHESWFPGDDAD